MPAFGLYLFGCNGTEITVFYTRWGVCGCTKTRWIASLREWRQDFCGSPVPVLEIVLNFIGLLLFLHPKGYNDMGQTILSKYVKEMRKRYNLTQVDLSEKAGVGLRFVRELEQGKTTLRMDKVNQVLNLFGSEVGAVHMERRGD